MGGGSGLAGTTVHAHTHRAPRWLKYPQLLWGVGSAESAREFRQNNVFLRYRLTPTLSDPRTATRIVARASSLRVRQYRSARVAPTRSAAIGTAVQRFLEQGASAWRRTIIVEVSHFAPPVAGAITAASRTTETASAAHAARLRRVVAKRHALPTINRGSCSARKNGHHQAFAGPQHLVGWR
jgi:hypothetical protein